MEEAVARLDRIAFLTDGEAFELPGRNPQEKQTAFKTLYWRLRTGPEERLRSAIGALAGQASIDAGSLVQSLCLGWDDLRTLAREPNVTIGAHTLSHPMLAKHDRETAWREITASRDAITGHLGFVPRHLGLVRN